MALTSLKAISQSTWLHPDPTSNVGGGPSRGGVCYYMCNFVENDANTWNNPGSFANAVSKGQNFASGTAMMNYAKAQSLKKLDQVPVNNYAAANGALANNRIYRIALTVEDNNNAANPGPANHEIMAITGNNDDIVYFDPNFGFFEPAQAGMNNRQAMEHFLATQYQPYNKVPTAFLYRNVRANNTAQPLSFQ